MGAFYGGLGFSTLATLLFFFLFGLSDLAALQAGGKAEKQK